MRRIKKYFGEGENRWASSEEEGPRVKYNDKVMSIEGSAMKQSFLEKLLKHAKNELSYIINIAEEEDSRTLVIGMLTN